MIFDSEAMTPKNYSPYKLMHDGILALNRAEQYGIQIDVPYCQKMDKHLARQIAYLENVFSQSELARVWKKTYRQNTNYNSGEQLAHVLFKVLKIEPVRFTKKDNPSVDEAALLALNMPEIAAYLEIRSLDKVKSTYIGGYLREQVEGILHCFFNLHLVVTYRSSSDSVNFQNQPNRDPVQKKMCRCAIIPRKGRKILCADYGGIEVKIAATYHKDPTMITYINDESKDMHRDTACDCFMLTPDLVTKPIRHSGKNEFVFPQFYGDWYRSCAESMWRSAQKDTHVLSNGIHLMEHLKSKGIKDYEKFEKHIQKVEEIFWYDRFPVYTEWKESWWEEYLKKGYFDMHTGFRCSGLMSRNDVINYPVQGPAFHCLLLSFIIMDRIQRERNWQSRLIAQIHDEIVMEVHPDEEDEVRETLAHVMTKTVPRIFRWINVPLIVEMEITPTDGAWHYKVPFCKCGGSPDMDVDGKQHVMYCTKCKKETAVEMSYDAAINAWKKLK